MRSVRTRIACFVILSLFIIETLSSAPIFALDKPPLKPDQPSDLVTQSHISATLRFSAPALERQLDSDVPRRLATFDDQLATCGHRRGFFRRQVDIQCVVTGYIERTAPIHLRAEGNRVEAEVKLAGSVYGQGARGLGRLIHGVAQGAMDVFVDANPRLTRDWRVDLNMAQSFRWTEPPLLRIFGRDIPIAQYVEPQILTQSRRVEDEVAAKLRAIDVRQKAETAWRRAFEPVQIADNFWLQMLPQNVAFAGVHTRTDILEGAIEFSGPVKTVFSGTAPPSSPTPLPALEADVAQPGHFQLLVPISLDYQVIREAVQPIASDAFQTPVQDVDVYPSDGSLIVGVKFASAPSGREFGRLDLSARASAKRRRRSSASTRQFGVILRCRRRGYQSISCAGRPCPQSDGELRAANRAAVATTKCQA
jgi:hypothetical protein